MIDEIKRHLDLLTNEKFFKSNPHDPGFKKTSRLVGYSSFFYLLPVFFIKNTNKWTILFKIIWIIQTVFVFTADYLLPSIQIKKYGKRQKSIIYGIDRLLATVMVTTMIIITYVYLDKIYLLGSLPPIYFVLQSKQAANEYDWDKMVLNQTLWHITGPIIVSYALYKIQQKHKLFNSI